MERHCRHKFKLILIILGVILLSFVSTAFALDPPHDNMANCDDCHNAAGLNDSSFGNIDNTPMNNMCNKCHYKGGPMEKVTHSSRELSTAGRAYLWNSTWTYECRACHNPHHQKQLRLYQGLPGNAAWPEVGYISSITDPLQAGIYNVVTVQGNPGWFDSPYGQWEGYVLQPNQTYPFYYRITGNTNNTLTTNKSIMMGTYAGPDSAFGIGYGKLIKDEINTLRPVTNYAGVTFGSNTWRTIMYLNNSGAYSQSPPSAATTPGTTAICVVCHTRTKYNNWGYANWGQSFDPTINPNYTDASSNPHLTTGYTSDSKSCWDPSRDGCHKPPEQGFDAGASCGDCHGKPMVDNSDLVVQIKNAGTYLQTNTGNADIGAHNKHGGLECSRCHSTGMLNPDDAQTDIGNFDIDLSFSNPGTNHNGGTYYGRFATDMVSTGTDTIGSQYNYAGNNIGTQNGTQTCNNVYCHEPKASYGSDQNPSWTQGSLSGDSGSCGACHKAVASTNTSINNPPTLGKHQQHVDPLNGPTMINALTCDKCHGHVGSGTQHVDGTVDLNLSAYSGALYNGASSSSLGSITTNDADYRTCQNLYCHSNGGPVTAGGTVTYKTPDWSSSSSSMTCGSCHNESNDAASNIWSYPHTKHMDSYGSYLSCNDCHNSVASSNTTIGDPSLHVNGSPQVVFNPAYDGGTAEYNGTVCSNVTCHSTGVRADLANQYFVPTDWNVTSDQGCTLCHKFNDTAANMTSGSNVMSATHVKHIANDTSNGNYNLDCSNCHNQTSSNGTSITDKSVHADGQKDVYFSAGGNYNSPAQYDCSNVYCHSDGKDTPTTVTPSWTSAASGACGTCHARLDSEIAAASGKHARHAGNGSTEYQLACSKCHQTVVSATTNSSVEPTITDTSLHVNGTQEVSFAMGGDAYGGTQCTNNYCHSNGEPGTRGWVGASDSYTTVVWSTAATTACDSCHSKKSDASATWSRAHEAHIGTDTGEYGSRFDCSDCHSAVVTGSTSIADKSKHVDGTKEVDISGTYGGAFNTGTGRCDNVKCHGTGQPGVFSQPHWDDLLDCSGCHKFADTTANMTGATNALSLAHIRHVAIDNYGAAARDTMNQGYLSTSNDIKCDNCHNATTTDNTSITNLANHVNLANDISFNISTDWPTHSTNTPAWGGSATKTCNNVYCHSDGMELEANRTFKEVSWNDAPWTGTTCNKCHGLPPNDGTHNVVNDTQCSQCHPHANTDDPATGFVSALAYKHLNGFVDQEGGCTNCHGQPPETTITLVNTTISNRGTEYSPKGWGAHVIHGSAGKGFACLNCHNGGQPDGGEHKGFTLNIEFLINGVSQGHYTAPDFTAGGWSLITNGSTGLTITGTSGNPNTRLCDNIYCHSNGGSYATGSNPTVYQTADWDEPTLPLSCDSCHGNGQGSGVYVSTDLHPTHVSTYSYACDNCHNDTVNQGELSIKTEAEHVDYQKDVAFANFAGSNGDAYIGGTRPECTNIYCHTQGTAASAPYDAPITTADWTGSLNCDGCHGAAVGGTEIATKAHSAHINDSGNQVGYDVGCTVCHNATAASDTSISTYGNHVDTNVNIKFDDSGINKNSFDPVYDGNTTTGANGYAKPAGSGAGTGCKNVYCHSNGADVDAGKRSYSTIAWGTNTIEGCDDCHGDGAGNAHPTYASAAAGQPGANSHPKHVGDGIACQECHWNTTQTGTTIAATNYHLDGSPNIDGQDVYFNPSNANAAGGTYDPTTNNKNCANTYCHGSLSVSWGGTNTCNDCHSGGTNGPLPGNHGVHFANTLANSDDWTPTNNSATGSYQFSCGVCHDKNQGVVHISGEVTASQAGQVAFATAYDISATYVGNSPAAGADSGFNWSAGTGCSNTYCHSNALGLTGAENPAWGGSLNSACGACHNEKGGSTPHAKHTTTYASNTSVSDCNACHAATASNPTTISDKSNHVNLTNDVSFNSFADPGAVNSDYTSPDCSNTYCHSDGTSSDPTHAATSWSGSRDCTGCHQAGTAINTGAHGVHVNDSANQVGFDIGCTECHNATASDNTTVNSVTNHVNYSVNIKFDDSNINKNSYGPVYDGNSTTGANGYGDTVGDAAGAGCNNVYCHSNGNTNNGSTPSSFATIAWNTTIAGCDDCHGDGAGKAHPTYATTGSYGGGSDRPNSHVQHVEAQSYNCSDCHNSTTTDNTTVLSQHLNGTEQVSMAGAIGGSYTGTGTCTTTTCHGSASDAWGDSTLAARDHCTICHGVMTTGGDGSAAAKLRAPGINGSGVDTNGDSSASDQQVGAHDIHLNASTDSDSITDDIACTECHNVSAITSSGHMDGSATFTLNSTLVTNATNLSPDYGVTTANTCTNVYCHGARMPYRSETGSNPGSDTTPLWSDTSYVDSANFDGTCGRCHGFPPKSGGSYGNTTHNAMTVGDGSGCSGCHTHFKDGVNSSESGWSGGVFATVANAALHINGSVEYVSSCAGCHVDTADVDSWAWDGSKATIKDSEWTSTGHGASSTYSVSGNPGADFQGVAGNDSCFYCHTSSGPSHPSSPNDPANYFKLITGEGGIGNTTYAENGLCMACHETGSAGVDPGTGNINATRKVGSRHYGGDHTTNSTTGGQYCWDCHDPHGDSNIYMIHLNPVSQSGSNMVANTTTSTAVSFTSNSTGTDYAQNSSPTGVCNVCHTYTSHYTASTGDSHNYDKRCTSCHTHTAGDFDSGFPGEGESTGGDPCNTCHSELYSRMHDSTANQVYKHYMNSDAATYGGNVQPTLGNRTCLMCHVDHDAFNPDVNASNQRAANLRTSITTTTYGAASGANSDFDPTTGGICVSCHWQQQTKYLSTNNGVQNVPRLPVANVASVSQAVQIIRNSSHNYSVQSGAFGDSTNFAAVCLKCHNDTIDVKPDTAGSQKSGINSSTKGQTAEPRFGLHQSLSNSFLAPMGAKKISDFKQGKILNVNTNGTTSVQVSQDLTADYSSFAIVITKVGGSQVQRKLVTATHTGSDIVNVAGPWDWTPAVNDLFELGKNVTPADDICFSCHSQGGASGDGFKDYDAKDFYNSVSMDDRIEGMYQLFTAGAGRLQADLRSKQTSTTICTDVTSTLGTEFENYQLIINGYRGKITSHSTTTDQSSGTCSAYASLGYGNEMDVNYTPQNGTAYTAGAKVELFKPSSHPLDTLGRHLPDEMLGAPASTPTSLDVANNIGDQGTCDSAASATTCTDTSKAWVNNSFGTDKLYITFTSGDCKYQSSLVQSNTATQVTFSSISSQCIGSNPPVVGDGYFIGNRHVSCTDCHNTHAAQRKPSGETDSSSTASAIVDVTKDTDAVNWGSDRWKDAVMVITDTGGVRRVRAVKGSTTGGTGTGTTYTLAMALPAAPPTGTKYEVVKLDGSTGPGGKGVWGVNISGFTTPSLGTLMDTSTLTFTKLYDAGGDVGGKQWMQCLRCHSYYGYMDAPPSAPSGNADGTAKEEGDLAAEMNPNNLAHHAIYAVGKNQPILPTGSSNRTDTNGLGGTNYNYSVMNLNWPYIQGTGNITSAGYVTLSGATLPANAIPGWYMYKGTQSAAFNNYTGNRSGWYQITSITDSTHFYIKVTAPSLKPADSSDPMSGNPYHPSATYSDGTYNSNVTITAGLGNAFVPPYGPWSIIRCTECHGSTLSDPLGPHASVNSWMIRSMETGLAFEWYNTGGSVETRTPGDGPNADYFCYNCHTRDTYLDAGNTGSTAIYTKQNRIPHGSNMDTNSNTTDPTASNWPQHCRQCHGGDKLGGIHGTNYKNARSSISGLYTNEQGKRFLNGDAWVVGGDLHRSTTSSFGGCYTTKNTSPPGLVDACGSNHSDQSYKTKAMYNYDNP